MKEGAPWVHRGWWYTTLQFSRDVTQSRMLNWWPDALQVGYTRTMMAALLLRPFPRRIGIIGLGGGSQAKFCHRHLPAADIEAFESDAGVLALRDVFRIPADSARFQIRLGDGASMLRQRRGAFDLLLVDAYEPEGISPTVSTQAFYDDCRAALAEGGAMAVNLYATDARRHLARLRRAFGGRALALEEPRMSNRIAFAWQPGVDMPDPREALARLPRSARWQLAARFLRLARARQAWQPRDRALSGT